MKLETTFPEPSIKEPSPAAPTDKTFGLGAVIQEVRMRRGLNQKEFGTLDEAAWKAITDIRSTVEAVCLAVIRNTREKAV